MTPPDPYNLYVFRPTTIEDIAAADSLADTFSSHTTLGVLTVAHRLARHRGQGEQCSATLLVMHNVRIKIYIGD